jgi:hypothetical protein
LPVRLHSKIKAAPVEFAVLLGVRLEAGQRGIGKGAAFYLGALHLGLYPLGSIISRGYTEGYTEGRYRGIQGEIARNKKARTRRAS